MTTFERFEREIPSLMDELSPPQLPDYFDDMLRQTARTSQRPAWSALERWLPMGVIAQTQTDPRIPWRPILLVGLLALLAAAAVFVVGSQQQPLPTPYGTARNGILVSHDADGRIITADDQGRLIGELDTGTGIDTNPWFANDGTKFAFDRQTVPNEVRRALLVADADGSNVRELVGPKALIRWFEWSPNGDRMFVQRDGDALGLVTLVDATTGESTTFTVPLEVRQATFRPGSDQLILASPTTLYRVNDDGSDLVEILSDSHLLPEQFAASPDGQSLVYTTWATGAEGRVHLVEIDSGVERPLDVDPGYTYTDLSPAFTPDGTALLLERYDATGYRPTIVPLDGSPATGFGDPHPEMTGGSARSMSPDGQKVLVTYRDDGTTWIYDVATASGRQLDWTPPRDATASWQRLAP